MISEIGPTSSVVIPDSVARIDATDWYLMPGVADMHVHLIPTEESVNDLFLFLANGVTTIRIMWGDSEFVKWREQVARDDLLGPTIYCASPGLDGPPGYWPTAVVSDVADARAKVVAYKAAGYDFIKVYNLLPPVVYQAIFDEASIQGLPVIGHIPRAVGFSKAVTAGHYSMEHLLGYAPHVTSDSSYAVSQKQKEIIKRFFPRPWPS